MKKERIRLKKIFDILLSATDIPGLTVDKARYRQFPPGRLASATGLLCP